jgi:hypothetical protein
MNISETTDWSLIALIVYFIVWAILALYLQYVASFWKKKYRISEKDKVEAFRLLTILFNPNSNAKITLEALREAEIFITLLKKNKWTSS